MVQHICFEDEWEASWSFFLHLLNISFNIWPLVSLNFLPAVFLRWNRNKEIQLMRIYMMFSRFPRQELRFYFLFLPTKPLIPSNWATLLNGSHMPKDGCHKEQQWLLITSFFCESDSTLLVRYSYLLSQCIPVLVFYCFYNKLPQI